MPMSTRRLTADGASFVWIVEKTTVPSQGGPHADLRRCQVPDFPEHNDIGSWRREARRPSAKSRPISGAHRHPAGFPSSLYSTGFLQGDELPPGSVNALEDGVQGGGLPGSRGAR